MKAVVLVIPSDDAAQDVARLIASVLSLNGYDYNKPEVIDWPVPPPRAQGGFGTGFSHQCQVCNVWVIEGQIHTCAGRSSALGGTK